ncbi:MAG: hypothetical protein FJ303_06435 [Planctomycetes bacterium]|nr:hypothetical protein [Planctomycetota bacterium]
MHFGVGAKHLDGRTAGHGQRFKVRQVANRPPIPVTRRTTLALAAAKLILVSSVGVRATPRERKTGMGSARE